jgi:hypothetical protein
MQNELQRFLEFRRITVHHLCLGGSQPVALNHALCSVCHSARNMSVYSLQHQNIKDAVRLHTHSSYHTRRQNEPIYVIRNLSSAHSGQTSGGTGCRLIPSTGECLHTGDSRYTRFRYPLLYFRIITSINILSAAPNAVVENLTLLFRILEVRGSNLGPENGYLDRHFVVFLRYSWPIPAQYFKSRPQPLPSTSFPTHHSRITSSFGAIKCESLEKRR